MDTQNILHVEGIEKVFGETHVLKNVSFSLKHGEIHGLMGENGAGKSSLIKIISGDYEADAGRIFLDGNQVMINAPKDSIKLGIRVIYQEFNIVKSLTVAENILLGNYPLLSKGIVDWKKLYADAQKILDDLGEKIPVKSIVGTLSVAEQQIIEIAKALSVRPKILIMDEPTAALNDQETDKLFSLLRRLKNSGVSIIYITHRFSEIYKLTDRITVMRDGEVIGTLATADATDQILVRMMAGRELNDLYCHREIEKAEIIFEARNLNIHGKLSDVSLSIRKGEIVVIFGLFGAGQNELCRALFGDIKLNSGEMFLHGKKISIRNIRDACNTGIGFVTDDRKADGLIPTLSVMKNISVVALPRLTTFLNIIKRRQEEKMAQDLIDQLSIRCSGLDQRISLLSGGNQQKGILSRWLANESKMLILNMPTRGVDVAARTEIYRALEELCCQGVAILVVSLEMPEVLGIADKIYVMHDKRIVAEVNRQDANQELLMKYAVGLK